MQVARRLGKSQGCISVVMRPDRRADMADGGLPQRAMHRHAGVPRAAPARQGGTGQALAAGAHRQGRGSRPQGSVGGRADGGARAAEAVEAAEAVRQGADEAADAGGTHAARAGFLGRYPYRGAARVAGGSGAVGREGRTVLVPHAAQAAGASRMRLCQGCRRARAGTRGDRFAQRLEMGASGGWSGPSTQSKPRLIL